MLLSFLDEEAHRVQPASLFMATERRTEQGAASPQSRGEKSSRRAVRVFTLALLALTLSACAGHFERYNAGAAEIWIGSQLMVQKECERRGVVLYSNDTKILGCADFARRVILSIPDPQVIAHEVCHWTLWTASHDVCPTPVAQRR